MLSLNLIQALEKSKDVKNKGITFIGGNEGDDFLSYSDLYNAALKGLSYLQANDIQPGQELVFQIEDNKTFIIVFWSCILGGIRPVPLSIGRSNDHNLKIFNVWEILDNPILAISKGHLDKLEEYALRENLDNVYKTFKNKIIDPETLVSFNSIGKQVKVKENDIAFIQFSSGSTGKPKGVILTHKNLITNINAISKRAKYSKSDSLMSWMPLTHDMGLIGFHLNPLLRQIDQYLIPTGLFVRRPVLWLDKIDEYKTTILSSPNFGLKYVMKHYSTNIDYQWDFTNVRIIFNGAEPISRSICLDFTNLLAQYGLNPRAMRPVYGLAEATLGVSISNMGEELISMELDRDHINIGDTIKHIESANNPIVFLNLGKSIEDCSIRITDCDDCLVNDQVVGHIQIKGASVTSGYYNNETETLKTITEDGWLKTGDLGFVKDESLYVTGRLKDLILLNGQNFYPHDIESAAETVAGIELNKISVSGFFNHDRQQEETIAFVFHRADIKSFIPILKELRSQINLMFGFELDHIIPVKNIPKTTSGKLQRFKLLNQYKKKAYSTEELEIREIIEREDEELLLVEESFNDIELKLSNIWKRVLNKRSINSDDTFFQLGGDSLKAAELQMLIFKEFKLDFPIDRLYSKLTIRSQAKELLQPRLEESGNIPRTSPREYYKLSAVQKRIYYAWSIDKDSSSYNIPVALSITGALDYSKLESCINRLIAGHSSLRTSFIMKKEPYFIVNEDVDFKLVRKKVQNTNLSKKLEELIKPFDLEIAPLFRVTLLEISDTDHIIFLDFHHAVSDGISISNFIDELFNLYQDSDLIFSDIDYKDYGNWMNSSVHMSKLEDNMNYWLEQLQGNIPLLELPTDFARPPLFETNGERIGFEIDKELTKRLRAFALDNDSTMHLLMLAFYFTLIAKYGRQKEHIVGIPVSGRSHPDLFKVHGMFANNLAIKTAVDLNEPFVYLLEKLKPIVTEALEHSDYSFDELVQRLGQKRDISRNPVFDSMFNYQAMGLPEMSDSGLKLSRLFFNHGISKFDLSIEVFENENTLRVDFEYASSLFKKSTILQMISGYVNLIGRILEQPQTSLGNVSLLSQKTSYEYSERFNDTEKILLKSDTIFDLFKKQVVKTPNNVAIDYEDKKITYAELNTRVDQVAQFLVKRLKNTNGIVGLILKRSPEMIISILAISKAGGCYLPLDNKIQEIRLKSILKDSQCGTIISDAQDDDRIKTLEEINDSENLTVSSIADGMYLYQIKSTIEVSVPTNLAYIIYTSGSTGIPKGVMIGQQQLLNYINWAAEEYVGDKTSNFPLFTSIAFDLTVTSIFIPLITGNAIVIYEDISPLVALRKVIEENKVHIIKLTPSHLKLLKNHSINVPEPSNIGTFIVGGERFASSIALETIQKFGKKTKIYNEYGPTETTVGSMVHLYSIEDSSISVPIGRPIANTQIYLLDDFLNSVPLGVPGEIYIAGAGLAKGYLHNSHLSESSFIPNPFKPGRKMYKTGDIAKRQETGLIEYVGRFDSQVKINGYRVELSEIEKQLALHPLVKEAVVTSKEGDSGHGLIYAYYLVEDEISEVVEESALRQLIMETLPYYMVPSYFIPIDKIPLTNNGKLDYSLLPTPISKVKLNSNTSASAIKDILLNTWNSIFNTNQIGLDDDFLAIGGDSIKAVQIAARLFEKGISIDVRDILVHKTITQISFHAKAISSETRYDQEIQVGEREWLPAESWLLKQNFKTPEFYNQSVLLRINKKIDVKLLQTSFDILIKHHDGLRANYNMTSRKCFYNNKHLQEPFTIEEFRFDPTNWNAYIDDNNSQPEIAKVFQSLKREFNLSSSLLIKSAIINIPEANDYLFITAHHLVIDGISWRIILEDLLRIYNALDKKEKIKLPRKTVDLNTWSKYFLDYLTQENFVKEKVFWREIDKHDFCLPLDNKTTDWNVDNLNKTTLRLDRETSEFLSGEANVIFGTDVAILLNTALALSLKSWLNIDNFIVEQENHGRHFEGVDASRSVGWFTAMYPVLISVESSAIGDLIKFTKEQMRSVPMNGIGYLPFINAENEPRRRTQIRFNYLGRFDGELDNELFTYSSIFTGNDSSTKNQITAVLEFNSMMVNGCLQVEINYNSKAHKESTINILKNIFEENLQLILQHLKNEHIIHFTPSDFNEAALDQADIDSLFK